MDGSSVWHGTSVIGVVGCGVYGLLALSLVSSRAIDMFHNNKRKLTSTPPNHPKQQQGGIEETRNLTSILYHTFGLVFCALRCAGFMTLDVSSNHIATYCVLLRRLGFAFSFSMYTFIVFWWCVAYSGRSSSSKSRSLVVKIRFLLIFLNAICYIATISFVAIWWVLSPNDWNNKWYNASIYTVIVLDLLTQIIVLALSLLIWIRQRDEVWFLRAGPRDVGGVLLCAAIFFLCCSCGAIMLLLRPLGIRIKSNTLFYIFAFFVPELLSTIVGIYVVHSGRKRATGYYSTDNGLVNELFREAHKTTPNSSTIKSPNSSKTATSRSPLLHHSSSPAMPVRALFASTGTPTSLPPSAFIQSLHATTTKTTTTTPNSSTSIPPILSYPTSTSLQ